MHAMCCGSNLLWETVKPVQSFKYRDTDYARRDCTESVKVLLTEICRRNTFISRGLYQVKNSQQQNDLDSCNLSPTHADRMPLIHVDWSLLYSDTDQSGQRAASIIVNYGSFPVFFSLSLSLSLSVSTQPCGPMRQTCFHAFPSWQCVG